MKIVKTALKIGYHLIKQIKSFLQNIGTKPSQHSGKLNYNNSKTNNFKNGCCIALTFRSKNRQISFKNLVFLYNYDFLSI